MKIALVFLSLVTLQVKNYQLMPAQTNFWKNYPCSMVTNTPICDKGKLKK